MSRSILSRLERLEREIEPPKRPVIIPMMAADDPEAERLMAEHEDKPGVTLIVLTGMHHSPGATVP